MSCARESLFTNVTRVPALTVSERGETTPADEMVIVASPDGDGEGVGDGDGDGVDVGELHSGGVARATQ